MLGGLSLANQVRPLVLRQVIVTWSHHGLTLSPSGRGEPNLQLFGLAHYLIHPSPARRRVRLAVAARQCRHRVVIVGHMPEVTRQVPSTSFQDGVAWVRACRPPPHCGKRNGHRDKPGEADAAGIDTMRPVGKPDRRAIWLWPQRISRCAITSAAFSIDFKRRHPERCVGQHGLQPIDLVAVGRRMAETRLDRETQALAAPRAAQSR